MVYWYGFLVCADLLTGLTAAFKAHTFSSRELYEGMKKKGLAFFFIICSHALDVAFGQLFYDKPFFQSIFLFAYILGEFCSIIENVISMGYADALPSWLGKIVRSLEPRLANAVDKQLDHVGLNNEEENKEKFP